jgi:hypothetical protein
MNWYYRRRRTYERGIAIFWESKITSAKIKAPVKKVAIKFAVLLHWS